MAKMYVTPWRIEFEGQRVVDTAEVLEMFDIPYVTLAKRRERNGFPEPIQRGQYGTCAMYDAASVIRWAEKHGFRI